MSRNELLVPEQQEAIVVDRLADEPISVNQAMSIVPGLEVTLAKRIIRPGSNRVMCLAAQTSVPLSDDDIASVSNLSLRLSDGTNVALSLSFFNDGATSAYVPLNRQLPQLPFNRYYFDPYRYTVHTQAQSGSRLGLVLVATALIAAGGLYYFLGHGLNKSHPPIPAKTALLSPALAHKTPLHSKTSKSAGAASASETRSAPSSSSADNSGAQSAERASTAKTAGKALAADRHGPRTASDSQSASENTRAVGHKFGLLKPRYEPSHPRFGETVHTSEPRPPRGNFFVPPPPPVMYSLPSGTPNFANFDFMQRMTDPPKSTAAASAKHSVRADQSIRQRPRVPESTPESAAESPLDLLGPLSVSGEKQNAIAAPIPGSTYPALERIVIPPTPQDP